ncbi:hypothetical protein LXA43DRAFT_477525 [Ganoderma leucocontextum]|nr:hypothetical protein LXA43DRAFT_477525 [Ganoderma leucocontextum]
MQFASCEASKVARCGTSGWSVGAVVAGAQPAWDRRNNPQKREQKPDETKRKFGHNVRHATSRSTSFRDMSRFASKSRYWAIPHPKLEERPGTGSTVVEETVQHIINVTEGTRHWRELGMKGSMGRTEPPTRPKLLSCTLTQARGGRCVTTPGTRVDHSSAQLILSTRRIQMVRMPRTDVASEVYSYSPMARIVADYYRHLHARIRTHTLSPARDQATRWGSPSISSTRSTED